MTGTARDPWRVAVVGGGPSGLMAAEVLATAGARVTVYDRMPTVGRKLQVAGRGGLNLTHSEPRDAMLDRYGPARAHLTPALERFDNIALRAWSQGLGQGTFVGSSGRVFPEGVRATALLRAWLERLSGLGVEVRSRHTWLGWDDEGDLLFRRGDGTATTVRAAATVLALGGASWPRTGSDGAWVAALEAAEVEITPLRPANCAFAASWTGTFRQGFAGTPVKDVTVHHRGSSARGDLMVTDAGIEGGPVYALTPGLREAIEAEGHAVLHVETMPGAGEAEVLARLARRRPRDSVTTGLRRAGLTPVVIGLLREATANHPPTDAGELAALLQRLPLRLTATGPIERAISTAGGVPFAAVDQRLMLTERPGTFVAGEMLDWEAPTGGYLLQAAFSTGVAAAEGVLSWLAGGRQGPSPTLDA